MSGFDKPRFEPYLESLGPVGPAAMGAEYDPGQRVLSQFSDVELLLELRRRKRLGRVTAEAIVPGHAVAQGYPLDRQILEAYRRIAHELNRQHQPDRQPPGCKLEHGGFHPWSSHSGEQGDRRVRLVLNYVVGPL